MIPSLPPNSSGTSGNSAARDKDSSEQKDSPPEQHIAVSSSSRRKLARKLSFSNIDKPGDADMIAFGQVRLSSAPLPRSAGAVTATPEHELWQPFIGEMGSPDFAVPASPGNPYGRHTPGTTTTTYTAPDSHFTTTTTVATTTTSTVTTTGLPRRDVPRPQNSRVNLSRALIDVWPPENPAWHEKEEAPSSRNHQPWRPSEDELLGIIEDRPEEILIEEESMLIKAAAEQASDRALLMLLSRGVAFHVHDPRTGRGWRDEHCPFLAAIDRERYGNLRKLLELDIQPSPAFKLALPSMPTEVKDIFREYGYML